MGWVLAQWQCTCLESVSCSIGKKRTKKEIIRTKTGDLWLWGLFWQHSWMVSQTHYLLKRKKRITCLCCFLKKILGNESFHTNLTSLSYFFFFLSISLISRVLPERRVKTKEIFILKTHSLKMCLIWLDKIIPNSLKTVFCYLILFSKNYCNSSWTLWVIQISYFEIS